LAGAWDTKNRAAFARDTAGVAKPFTRDEHQNELCLPDLARQIRDAHAAVHSAGAALLHHAMAAGDALLSAQAKVNGSWKLWLRDNCFLSVRTALVYVRLARHRSAIETELGRASDLSLRGALRLIAKPKGSAEKNRKSTNKPTLLDHWKNAPGSERRALLDAIGIDGIRRAASFEFLRVLRARVRVGEVAADPDTTITNLVTKALSHIVAADAPQTSDPVAAGNVNEALASLRAALKKLNALGCSYHDVHIGIAAKSKSRRAA
jgi:hypothetical protein